MKLFGLHIPSFSLPPLRLSAPSRHLYDAVKASDLPAVLKLAARASRKQLASTGLSHALDKHTKGSVELIEALLQSGDCPVTIDRLLFYAAMQERDDVAFRVLELGANPAHGEPLGQHARPQSAFDLTKNVELLRAIAQRLTPMQRDDLLPVYVQEGKAPQVRALLSAGADATRLINGRTLLQMAPADAEDVKRMLRSVELGALLESAMGGTDAQAPAPAKPSLTL